MNMQRDRTKIFRLFHDKGAVDVFELGAHIHNYRVNYDDGYVFTPFAKADWLGDERRIINAGLPDHLHQLGGEFPCIPFGSTSLDSAKHGFGVVNPWKTVDSGDNFIALEIQYPESHKVRSLQRTITIEPATGALRISLQIVARDKCRLPIGFHPNFKLTADPKSLRVTPPAFERGAFIPASLRGNSSGVIDQVELVSPGASCWDSISAMESSLFQLWNVSGSVTLEYLDEQCAVDLEWDQNLLPDCLFWIANPEFQEYGLGDGFVGMGVEPTNSFFDKNDSAHNYQKLHQRNPDSFGVNLQPNETLSTYYRIVCRRISPVAQEKI